MFYFVLQFKNKTIGEIVNFFPINNQYKAIVYFADYFMEQDNREKTFLVLFQNNMEIRPGGGFIGSFGILKIKNRRVKNMQIFDSGNFDKNVSDTILAPYPMPETLHIKWLQLRDSNFSPDFPSDAAAAEKFYHMGQGQEKFDGIVGVTSNVLISFLKATGPVEIPGYPGTYADENAVLALEYQVEKAFDEQGIARDDRKDVMNELAEVILEKISTMSLSQKIDLAKIIYADLDKKDIQLYFHDPILETQAEQAGWAGRVDQTWEKDYLMTVDANLGAWKTDRVMKRSLDYSIDLSGAVPKAVLKITYNHTATQRDFMTKDYIDFLRVYVPAGSELISQKNADDPVFGAELGKKYFGFIVYVPLGESKTVEINYILPKDLADNYNLKIQKQAGLNDIPVAVHVIGKNGQKKDYQFTMNGDIVLNK